MLPGIRGGGKNELELTKIINNYQTSAYFYEHVDSFLGVRTRELETIANVLAKAEEGSSIKIDFGGTGDGNICIQVISLFFVPLSEFGKHLPHQLKTDPKRMLLFTLPTAEILSGKNLQVWVSMVSYLKK